MLGKLRSFYERAKKKVLPSALAATIALTGALTTNANANTVEAKSNTTVTVQKIQNNIKKKESIGIGEGWNVIDIDYKNGHWKVDEKESKKANSFFRTKYRSLNEFDENVPGLVALITDKEYFGEFDKKFKPNKYVFFKDLNKNGKLEDDEVFVYNPYLDNNIREGIYSIENLKEKKYNNIGKI